jgi:hypothetical protein
VNRKKLFAGSSEPPALAALDPELAKPCKPPIRLAPAEGYPVVLIPPADRPGQPTGAQRVRAALKTLRRQYGVRAEWLPAQRRSDDEQAFGASEASTRETACHCGLCDPSMPRGSGDRE